MSDQPPAKMARVEENGGSGEVEGTYKDFGSFQFERVLKENSERRLISVLGKFPNCSAHPDAPAIVIIEKTPFGGEDNAKKILTGDTKLVATMRNEIYHKYDCHISPAECNLAKVSLIYPATPKHIRKHESSPRHLVYETPAMYKALTLPYLQGEKFDMQWIYNILSHKQEADTIVYEDTDCDDGFVLLPDYKWNGKQLADMYLVAITQRRDVKSVRDLKACHLPLLNNMWDNGCKAITKKYGIPQSQIRAYFHYQPSYYHLHVHFTLASYTAPGCSVEGAHLLPMVIRNIQSDPHFYEKATLPFPVNESDNLFSHYKKEGYEFDSDRAATSDKLPSASLPGYLDFFRQMGRAKHEPCGEHWTVTYGESAWRMAIMTLCLPRDGIDRARLVRQSLASAFTGMGQSTDHCSEWPEKIKEVRSLLCKNLPGQVSLRLFEYYSSHASCRRGLELNSREAKVYRKLVEFEEALLQWEEIRKEGENPSMSPLVKAMCDVGFPGCEKAVILGDSRELEALLKFIMQASVLMGLKRTGWVRSNISDPETVASHMFRMGIMAMVFEEAGIYTNDEERREMADPVVLTILHDLAEALVGDITPKDDVTDEEKHKLEMEAMRNLVKDLPGPVAKEIYTALERYESQRVGDEAARLTKDLDKLDMILQADEYEQGEPDRGAFLQEFFDSTVNVFKTDPVKKFVAELRGQRGKRMAEQNDKQ